MEEVRTDVRVANLSYIQAGWYIEMMRQKAFKSDPLPFSLSVLKNILKVSEPSFLLTNRIDKPVNLKEIVSLPDVTTENI